MSFLDKTGLQTLTNKLVQGDAIKVASHRGRTVKNVIDNIQRECDNVANPLEYKMENRVADFKIGKCRDVDVSGDVENGCTEVELQGKTYQNLYIKDIFNGDISNWSALTSEQYSFSDGYLTLTANGGYVNAFEKISTLMVKPNTKYTAIFDIKENTLSTERSHNFTLVSGTTSAISDTSMFLPPKKTGLYPVSFTTKSDLSACSVGLRSFIYTGTMSGKITFNYILLEGDHTQTPTEELPQYFEGIKSSFEDGIVDVEVTGKNLLETYTLYSDSVSKIEETNDYLITEGSGNIGGGISFRSIKVKPNTTYVISMTCQAIQPTSHSNGIRIWQPYKGQYISSFLVRIPNNLTRVYGKFTTPSDCDEVIDIWCGKASDFSEITRFKFKKDWMLEESSTLTTYQPYYKKKISFNIGEPLRSLPNGVCDEIRNNNGQWELVRRVKKVTYNGTESWGEASEVDGDVVAYYRTFDDGVPVSTDNIYCDTLPVYNYGKYTDIQGIMSSRTAFIISIKTKNLTTADFNGFIRWLTENPTTVYYESATPIISPIEPIEFEIKPLGSININSDISPVSYHTVQLNRAGQIERAICNIAELKNRVEALETIYDSHFLETQHKLSLLEMDYELEGGSI